jgi:signal transduction histidine kinase
LEEEIEEPTNPVHPEDLPAVMEKWLTDMAAGEPCKDEMRLRRADGEYRWFLVRTAPLRDEWGNLVKWYGASIDIEDRKQAEEKLKATSEQLRALSASLQSAREEEATRIAREIHDELGAALSSLRWDLEDVVETVSKSEDRSQLQELRKKIEAMTKLIDNTINTVRRIASELRPSVLDDLGLVVAIKWQAQQFQNRTGIIVDCDCPLDNVDLNQAQSTAVFRIFQEALTNILRHARATRVNIQMNEEDGQLILTINDNGRGVTADEKSRSQSLGLLGMQERAHLIGGNINIIGFDGKGTVVTVRIPISGQKEYSKASL